MSARIYTVTDTATEETFLIKANSQAQAVRHVASARYDCDVPSALEVAEKMAAGAVVEDATASKVAE